MVAVHAFVTQWRTDYEGGGARSADRLMVMCEQLPVRLNIAVKNVTWLLGFAACFDHNLSYLGSNRSIVRKEPATGKTISWQFQQRKIRSRDIDTNDRLLTVFSSVFGAAAEDFSNEDGPATVDAWDSVTHLMLILAIEAEFGIQFDTAEIPNLLSVGEIRARLES